MPDNTLVLVAAIAFYLVPVIIMLWLATSWLNETKDKPLDLKAAIARGTRK